MNYRRNYYKILRIDENADIKTIKKAYKKLALKYHPDVNQSEDAEKKFKLINEAYSVLSNEEKRKEYDAKRRALVKKQSSVVVKEDKNPVVVKRNLKRKKRRHRRKKSSSLSKYVKAAGTLEKEYGLISGVLGLRTSGELSKKGKGGSIRRSGSSPDILSTLLNSTSNSRKGHHKHRHGKRLF